MMQETLKKIENDLIELEVRNVTLFIKTRHLVLNGFWTWDMQASAIYASDVMSFPSSFEGTKGIIHPDDLPIITNLLELLQENEIPHLEFRIITTYGEVKYVKGYNVRLDEHADTLSATEFLANAGEIEKIILRKEKTLLNLQESLAEYAGRVHALGYWYINKSSGEVWYSDSVFRIHGVPPQSMNVHANTFNSFIHGDDREIVLDNFERAYQQEVPLHIEYRIIQPDGTIIYLQQLSQWYYTAYGEPVFGSILKDISDIKETEGKLRNAHNSVLLTNLIMEYSGQQTTSGYWIMNMVTRKTIYSANYYRIYGIRQPSFADKNVFLSMVHPEDFEMVNAMYDQMYREHILQDTEFRIIRPDGKQRFVKQSGKLIVSDESELLMIGVLQDITVKKGAEKKVSDIQDALDLQKMLNEAAEMEAGICFLIWLPNGQMYWSDGVYKMLGYRPGGIEPLPRLLYRGIHVEDVKAFKNAEMFVLDHQNHEDVRFRIISKSGIRQLTISYRQISIKEGQAVLGTIRDITDLEKQKKQLSEAIMFSQNMMGIINDIVIVSNLDHSIIYWNDTAAQKTGVPEEAALNRNLFDLFPGLNDENYLGNLRMVFEDRMVNKVGVRGGYFNKPYNFHLQPVKDEKGSITGIMHLVQDVSKEMELQQQLSERLNFIESLVESSVDRVVVLDSQMNYIYWNHKAEEYYAISKQKVLGKNIMEVFPGFKNDPGYQEFRKVLKGETVHIPATLQSDGTSYFETYLSPVKNELGSVIAVLWIVHDLSRERQLQREQVKTTDLLIQEHHRLKEAQAIGHVGSFEWNRAADKIFCSDELYRIYGLEPQSRDITMESWFEFVAPEDQQMMRTRILQLYKEPLSMEFKHSVILAGGRVRRLIYKAESFADKDGQISHVTGTVQDITDLVHAEEQLKALNLSLHNQNEELAYKNEELSSFILMASHDLREPLRKVQIFGDWLLNEESKNLSSKGKDLLEKTIGQTRRMDILIDDMLVLSRLHHDKGSMTDVDLNEVLLKTKSELKGVIESKGVTIESKCLPVLQGNFDQLFYLFSHLIDNAIKFQTKGVLPVIRIVADKIKGENLKHHKIEADKNYWRIAVIDNGIGFDQQHATRIFQIFQRLHGNYEFSGTGIGLAICRKVMENHNGFIEAISSEGAGSTFYCYFPEEEGTNIE